MGVISMQIALEAKVSLEREQERAKNWTLGPAQFSEEEGAATELAKRLGACSTSENKQKVCSMKEAVIKF